MKWFPNWAGQTAVVFGSGPSARRHYAELVRPHKVIAVNSSVDLVPFADIVYATDHAWWISRQGLPHFKGTRVSANKRACMTYPQVQRVEVPPVGDKRRPTIILNPKGLIGSGGNSGFQAINIAAQSGASKIVLVGFDMSVARGAHFFGDHPVGLRNPQADLIDKWRRALDNQADVFRAAGITVINTSLDSALTAYPKMAIEEALR